MSTAGMGGLLLMPRPARLGARLAFGVGFPLVIVVVTVARSGSVALAWFGALFCVAQASLAVAMTHKELAAASPSFFQPGLRRRLAQAQAAWALGLAGLAALAVGALVPGFGGQRALSLAGAALVVHAVAAQASFRLAWSFHLPFWIFYAWLLVRHVDRLTRSGALDGFYDAAWVWLPVGVLLQAALYRTVRGAGLHRRVHGMLVLGAEDLFRLGRLTSYKLSRSRGHAAGGGPRWLHGLVGAQLRRAAAGGARGDAVAVRRRQLEALCLASGISPRPWVLWMIGAITLVSMVLFGYYDGSRSWGTLDRWFSGLLYQGATWPFYGLSAFLLAVPGGVSRRTGLRAECGLMARLSMVAFVGAVATYLASRFLAAVLPPVTRDGVEIAYMAVRPHGLWLVPLLAPFAWLGLALRPRVHSQWPTIAVGPLFILGHALLTVAPYRESTPLLAAGAAVALALAYALRRRWWERADIGH